jgi:hypothetical protein
VLLYWNRPTQRNREIWGFHIDVIWWWRYEAKRLWPRFRIKPPSALRFVLIVALVFPIYSDFNSPLYGDDVSRDDYQVFCSQLCANYTWLLKVEKQLCNKLQDFLSRIYPLLKKIVYFYQQQLVIQVKILIFKTAYVMGAKKFGLRAHLKLKQDFLFNAVRVRVISSWIQGRNVSPTQTPTLPLVEERAPFRNM